jgi:hypothetical protein
LTYQVGAEAVVWCLVDESEPGGKVEMTRSCKRVIGPEHQSAVTGRTRASQCRPESNGDPYGRSLTTPQGPWGGFAESTVRDWLQLLQEHQPEVFRSTAAGAQQRTRILATLRGALLDLLATGETARVTAAVEDELEALWSTSTNH